MCSARRCWLAVSLLVLVVVAPSTAAADAEKLLQESMVRFRIGEFRPALRLLRKARRQAKKDPALRARVHLQTGIVLGVMRRKKRARRTFRKALKLDPTLLLDAGDTKKQVRELFIKVRSAMKGSLKVTAGRPGTVVHLDGKELGKAPHSGKVVVGSHKVTVSTPDRLYMYRTKVVIRLKEQTVVVAKLAFVGARINVISLPSGAAVKVDGKPAGNTPLTGLAVPAGEHEIRVELAGRTPFVKRVDLKPGATPSIAATLHKEGKEPEASPMPVAVKQPTSIPSPTSPADVPAAPGGKRRFPLWTVVAGGAALALAGMGIGMGAASSSAFGEYEQTRDQQRYLELQDDIRTYDTVMAVSYATAGALVITAAVLYFVVERPGRPERQTRVTPLLSPAFTGVSVDF